SYAAHRAEEKSGQMKEVPIEELPAIEDEESPTTDEDFTPQETTTLDEFTFEEPQAEQGEETPLTSDFSFEEEQPEEAPTDLDFETPEPKEEFEDTEDFSFEEETEQTPQATQEEENPFAALLEPGAFRTKKPSTKDSEIETDFDETPENPFETLEEEEPQIPETDFEEVEETQEQEEPAVPEFDVEDDFSSLSQPVTEEELKPVEIEDHDPFADLEHSTGFDEQESEIEEVEDTEESESLGGLGELDEDEAAASTDFEQSLEDDLSSLAEESVERDQELTDEELAIIQREILNYPPTLKRAIIDAITKDRISRAEQRELLELIKASQPHQDIAAYLTEKLGYQVYLADPEGKYSEAGIPIIATKPIYTKKGEFERRQRIKRNILLAAAGLALVVGLITGYKYVYKPLRAASYYEDGLNQIKKAGTIKSGTGRKELLDNAERSFRQGEKINPGDLEYLNKFGMAYMKIGEYERAFEKLFGKVEPDFGKGEKDASLKVGWTERKEIPYIELETGQKWDDRKVEMGDNKLPSDPRDFLKLKAQDKVPRRILKAGAYIYSRLAKKIHDNTTYINLGRFHTNNAVAFIQAKEGLSYKNDDLGINYFKHVFMDGGEPDNVEARAGLAKVYYNQQNYGKAVSQYNIILEKYPKNPIGHGGLLSTYIEMWKRDRNPQYVLNHHRRVRNELGIEEDLSLYTLSKLAGFYIELDPTELRIRYNINPEDQVTNMDIADNIIHILNIAFSKSEKQDGVKISGDEYAEQYYQRGRFYIARNESLRALQQFELAANYDPAHYLAVMEMAEHYMRIENYDEARKLLQNALKRYKNFKDYYGNREEDETLIQGDVGRLFFNLGKIIYLDSALPNRGDRMDEFPARKVYPFHAMRASDITETEKERRDLLKNAMHYFELAEKHQIKDARKQRELFYYLGWIDYINGDFESALSHFTKLSEEDGYNNPSVMMAKANSYYYLGQVNASLGNYLKVIEDFETKAAQIANPVPDESTHQEVYQTLIAAYNNIGACYERKNNSSEALKYYWKSIEAARRINSTTEIANFNKDMVFRNRGNKLPLLDDWLSPTIDSIRELRNSKKKNTFF
ncbi:MAG: tetratricopeptide repeat protein, partial [Leptospiraceae bacterium]|nr:tetratricopeptide repeat protein [Leptospiraceae bacterium]